MNFVRSLIDGGFADLHHPEYWDLGWVEHSPLQVEYRRMVEAIGDSVRFMETLAGEQIGNFSRVDFYTSHEALLLHYEQAQTRQVRAIGAGSTVDAFPVDRHAHGRARRRARRILPRYPQSDRAEGRTRA
jgi:3-deoxy-D-arabino-heptulosonate 7-phosphate (DAHP) synthase class II